MTEYRRILLDGAAVQTVRDGEFLVAADGRRVAIEDAQHLPPLRPQPHHGRYHQKGGRDIGRTLLLIAAIDPGLQQAGLAAVVVHHQPGLGAPLIDHPGTHQVQGGLAA